jgi:flagellar motor switch protein FliN/FliY
MDPEDVTAHDGTDGVVDPDAGYEPAVAPAAPDAVEVEPDQPDLALVPPPQEVALEPLAGDLASFGGEGGDLSRVLDVPVELTVEMGRAVMTIRETLAIGTGSIVTLTRLVGEPVDLFANGRLIARGEVIAIDEEYGLRVTEVLATSQHQAA